MSKSSAAADLLTKSDEDLESVLSEEHSSENEGEGDTTTSGDKETTSGGLSDKEAVESEKLQIAKSETAAVFRLRILVFCVLALAAAAVSIVVYEVTSSSNTEEYKTQYHGASNLVLLSFQDIIETKLPAISSLGVALISHGNDVTGDWPFHTISNFPERASTARLQSHALSLQVNPMVPLSQRDAWESFVKSNTSYSWIDESIDYQTDLGMFDFNPGLYGDRLARDGAWPIWYYGQGQKQVTDETRGPYFPTWQSSPLLNYGNNVNENLYHPTTYGNKGIEEAFGAHSVVIGEFIESSPGDMFSWDLMTAKIALLLSTEAGDYVHHQGDPVSHVYFPIFDSFGPERQPVAVMLAWIHWADYFRKILPEGLVGMFFVLENTCGGEYTYRIDGEHVIPIGKGDLHDPKFDTDIRTAAFDSQTIADGTKLGIPLDQTYCRYSIRIYPSEDFEHIFKDSTPVVMTFAVALVFVFTAFMFLFYDRLVERRQALVMAKAAQTYAVVASLFPENVRDRLIEQSGDKAMGGKDGSFMSPNRRLKGYLNDGEDNERNTPIADLFPHCTVMFADISGFTAWSSTREPAQVFILLQTVYQAFDKIANRRKVFKVETIGDSYVAVTGLPETQPTHAVIMTRFAAECKSKFNELTGQLESSLGPDTADLAMRFGLHSGPVTAGVLLGERARFQLFGDTVNTASRMESTGVRNKIQCSRSTVACLAEAEKEDWYRPRDDKVEAKGKGSLQTYWLCPKSRNSSGGSSRGSGTASVVESVSDDVGSHADPDAASITAAVQRRKKTAADELKQKRLVNWIVDLLHEHIRKLVAMRKPGAKPWKASFTPAPGTTVLDEVAETIILPRYDQKSIREAADPSGIDIGSESLDQLTDLVAAIASQYRSNPFHNFEHACHVTMATNKFLKRIEAPDIENDDDDNNNLESLHNYTHGINSDPLTLLAIVFSALIHDVDHRGVSNPQLIIEEKDMGEKYHKKSVAEQNSLDIAWELLMDDKYETLRSTLFTSEDELKRFRQVIVNVVLATDIFDRQLNGLRKARWERAFNEEDLSAQENTDLRATIVIEHIIQASDVSHTMQHWHVYRKWNKCLFKEMYVAYREGRMAKDPSAFWYQGELGFFDNYVIPLAKKLKDCQVFGVSSDECLNYSTQNRDEWKDKGEEIVAQIVKDVTEEYEAGKW